jgi:hypothetical protein
MLAEALRRIIPLADSAAHQINERWAVRSIQGAHLILEMWSRQDGGRKKRLGGPLPSPPRGFCNVVDNPEHPSPVFIVPAECVRRGES